MSKRAEQAAIKAYPVVIEEHTERDLNKPRRLSYINGYEQAEKDLALTWEDVKKIEDLCMEVATLFASVGRNKVILEPPFYEEVLRRFNIQHRKK